jgi:hypothetical protein
MAVATALAAVVVGLAAGAAGDFLMLLTSGIAIGAWIASGVFFVVERASTRQLDAERYLLVGGLVGGAVGLALAIIDALL